MGISSLAVCRGGGLAACLRSAAKVRRTQPTDRDRQNQHRAAEVIDEKAVYGGATASMVIAGGEPAKRMDSLVMLPRTDLDHDVSILITAVEVAGR
jgi:hypothetical protein